MLKSILKTTLVAGVLDISAAFVQAWFMSGVTPGQVLRYIASGAFGKAAHAGGLGMAAWGLFFHFLIAFVITACFFWIYPKWRLLGRHLWLDSLLIGLAAWVVTTRVVVPLSQIGASSLHVRKALLAIGILVCCVGLPVALGAKRFYQTLNK
ncbi:MAG: hypothetical protein AAB316_00435 [Bacteroidota bacterium]